MWCTHQKQKRRQFKQRCTQNNIRFHCFCSDYFWSICESPQLKPQTGSERKKDLWSLWWRKWPLKAERNAKITLRAKCNSFNALSLAPERSYFPCHVLVQWGKNLADENKNVFLTEKICRPSLVESLLHLLTSRCSC